jgi:hypothetical protein
MRAGQVASIVLCGVLGACASGDNAPTFLSDPGKFQYHNCEQITAQGKAISTRQQDLKRLIDKAGESAGGSFVGAIAYQTDYIAATEDLRLLKAAAAEKNCGGSAMRRSGDVAMYADRCSVERDPSQPQGIAHHADRRQRHRGGCDYRR